MPIIENDGVRVEVDGEGYLVNFDDWSEKVACHLADREGVSKQCPLSDEKMEILRFMREYYQKFESFPILRAVCRNVQQDKDCTYEQFPDPIVAWKIAGLPKPTTEVFAYIEHKG